MSLRNDELLEVVDELGRALIGAVVQKAFAPLPRLAYLEMRQVGRSVLLCLSAEPQVARLSVALERPRVFGESVALQKMLRQELVGLKLSRVTMPHGRVVCLELGEGEGRRQLVCELVAPGALLLLGARGQVLAWSGELDDSRAVRPGGPYPLPPAGPPGPAPPSRLPPGDEPFARARAAEELFAPLQQARWVALAKKGVLGPLRQRRQRLVRTVEKVRAEASRQGEAERHLKEGELLSRNLHLLRRGQRAVRLTDYAAQGVREVEIALDPSVAPKDQAERRFRQYRRLQRGCEHARRRLEELTQELAELDARLAELEQTPEEELLARAPPGTTSGKKARAPEARPHRVYRSAAGEPIWVGKNAAGNDALTFQLARPSDLWLHVRGVGGSHVVVPRRGPAQLSQELLLDAAHLAAHHSSQKGEPRAEVSYTTVKFVRKVKGGAPGQVTYTREKTLLLRIEPERMARLLKSEVSSDRGTMSGSDVAP